MLKRSRGAAFVAVAVALLAGPGTARADEGGGGFWLPGQFASFAAQPFEPGFLLETTSYVSSGRASAERSFSRGINIAANYAIDQYLVFVNPGYAFHDPVLGGQLYLGVSFTLGRADVSASVSATGPLAAVSTAQNDSMTAPGDFQPSASLSWTVGNHSFMTYGTVNVPVGAYDVTRLAGIGLGYWAIDAGAAYTFAKALGFEFSATAGITYNFMNSNTLYQSGVDGHLDWGASYSFSEALYVGAVGYFYRQLGGDSGPGAQLGPFMSRVTGIGPQIGYTLDLGVVQADLNLRGYREFDADNRPEGWNVWFSVTLSKFRPRGRERRM